MPVTMQSLGIDRLSWTEQVRLAEEIWEAVRLRPPFPLDGSDPSAPPALIPISDELRAELQRRAAEDPDGGIPWEQVEAELREEFGEL